MSDKEHLERLDVKFSEEEGEGRVNYDEAVMDMLRPHCNLERLAVRGYQGASMVGWAMEENLSTSLPNLVSLSLWNCPKLSDLRCLGNLSHLKCLFLFDLENLEYIIEKYISGGSNDTRAVHVKSGQQFFPSLKYLNLRNMPKLKGWVGDADELHFNSCNMSPLVFSQLENLLIESCPKLIAVFHFSLLKSLNLSKFNRRLQIIIRRLKNEELEEDNGKETSNRKFSSSPYFGCPISNLREILIDDTTWVDHWLHMEALIV